MMMHVVARPSKKRQQPKMMTTEGRTCCTWSSKTGEVERFPWRKVHAQLHQNGISRRINFRNARAETTWNSRNKRGLFGFLPLLALIIGIWWAGSGNLDWTVGKRSRRFLCGASSLPEPLYTLPYYSSRVSCAVSSFFPFFLSVSTLYYFHSSSLSVPVGAERRVNRLQFRCKSIPRI